MNYKRLKVLTLLSLGAITLLSMVGATAGSLAWYAYITHVGVAFKGTTVQRTELLQVGIVDEKYHGNFHFTEERIDYFGLEKLEVSEDKRILWAPAGGGLIADIIAEYVINSPYRNNFVSPVSSRSRLLDEEVNLYGALLSSGSVDAHDNSSIAVKSEYVKVPFAFKVLNNNGTTMANRHVWVNDTTVSTSYGHKTDKGVRVYFENLNENTYTLLNPSSTSTTGGVTRICGVLDLDGDGFYDYDEVSKKEIVYGQYPNSEKANIIYSTSPYVPSNPDEVDDVNGVGDLTPSTFVAKHKEGVYVADYSNVNYANAYFDSLATVRPQIDDETGSFIETSGKPVCLTTESSIGAIGYTNMTIYLEGWDLAIDNRCIDTTFNLGLLFEINKVY